MFWSIKGKIAALVSAGLMLATVGLVTYLIFPTILENQIKKRLILSEGSETYKYWKDIPVPIYIHFYFFNVTNPEEVYQLEKPDLEEVGPYTFREEREKVNITWHENGTVSYRQVKRWYYQPDRTTGSLQDNIISLNVPMVAAAAKVVEYNSDFLYSAIQEMFHIYDSTWLVKKTVDELLFKGYEDPLLKFAQTFMDLPYDKFGWFYARNNTDDGEFVVYTGEENIEYVDTIYTWNGTKSVSCYDAPCNMINGSAGDIFPSGLTEQDRPTIFITDLCRSLSFTYLNEQTINGIKAFRYWADNTELDNGKYNPNNKCFCYDDDCLPAGGVNVSACKFDAPAVVSYPHFLFADPIYSDAVIGMRPNPEEHRMYLDLIPEMGVPLGVAARMQINIIFDLISNISQFSNITRRTYFPMLWFSETAVAGTDVTDQMKLPLVTLPLISNIISFFLVALGSFFVSAAFVLAILFAAGVIKVKPRNFSNSPIVEDNSSKLLPEKEPSYSAVNNGDPKVDQTSVVSIS